MVDKKILTFFAVGLVGGFLGLAATARMVWHGKFYPGVYVGTVDLGGMKREDGTTKLAEAVKTYSLTFTFNGASWQTPTEIFVTEVGESAAGAYRMGRRKNMDDYLSVALGQEKRFPLKVSIDEQKFNKWMEEVARAVEIPPVYARAEIKSGKVTVINGSDGVILDQENLRKVILERAENVDTAPLEVPLKAITRRLDEKGLQELQVKAEAIKGDTLELVQDDERIFLRQEKLVNYLVDEGAINEYATSLSTLLNRDPQDAKFEFAEGRVKGFAPSKDGVKVDVGETTKSMKLAFEKLLGESKSEKVEVTVTRTPPKITTDSVNNLGIEERIGRGESYYAHSIANRVYNVGLASGRVSGVLVPPGEEFSFNKFVGEISGAAGYKTAYVISGGRTVLGDGGGVCQVSTTLFRAAMNAGLPITERWAHAYRVGYYEQNSEPGIDATVYSPSKDFKFKNDTPAHILVQAINDPKNLHLVFEIYGTKDGRVATVSKPVVLGVSPPPPDKYEDDPNLPTGTIKQVDWAAWGAKTSFNYKVSKADGSTLFEKTYTSNYRPWADIFIRGTAPITQ